MSIASSISIRLGHLFASSYVRAVAMLSTGQTIAMAIPILAAPVLGRLYDPKDYGVLGSYMAIAAILGALSTFQLHQGIIAEHSEGRAEALVQVCMRTAIAVSLIAAAIAIVLFLWMAGVPAYDSTRHWMLLLPASTLAAGATMAIAALANRRRRYGVMAQVQVYAVSTTVAASIALGLFGWGAHGLFAAYFLGQAITLAVHAWLYGSMVKTRRRMNSQRMKALLRRHRRFAMFTLPSEFLGQFNQQLPVLVLTALGAAPLLGSFTRARQLVSLPVTLLGSSIAQVFRQRASEQYRTTGSCRSIYQKTFLVLLVAGLLPVVFLIVYAPLLFRIFLGPNWGEAGEIARILAPMLLLRLICSPLSSVYYFTGAQQLEFKLALLATVTLALFALGPYFAGFAPIWIVYGFAFAYSLVYCTYVAIGWAQCRL